MAESVAPSSSTTVTVTVETGILTWDQLRGAVADGGAGVATLLHIVVHTGAVTLWAVLQLDRVKVNVAVLTVAAPASLDSTWISTRPDG